MATIQELEEGIRRADQAGDAASVQILGTELLKLRQAQPAPTTPTAPTQATVALPVENVNSMTPMGNVVPGMETIPMPNFEEAAPVVRGVLPALSTMAAGAGVGALVGGPPGALAGAGIAGIASMVGDPIVAGVNALFNTRIKTPTQAWAEIMDYAGIPESSTEGQKLIEAIARGGASAMSSLGGGALLQTMNNPIAQNIGRILASGPLEQLAGGAVGGGTGELARYGAEELGMSEGSQAVASFVGGLLGGIGASKIAKPRTIGAPAFNVPGLTPQEVSDTVREAEAAGRRVFTSDVFRPETWYTRRLQDLSEGVMFLGTAGGRKAQHLGNIRYVDDVLAQYGAAADRELAQEIAQSVDRARSARISYWGGIKDTLVDRISGNVPNLQSPELGRTFTQLADEIDALNQINPNLYRPVVQKLMDFGEGLLGQPIYDAAGNVIGRSGISLRAAEENLVALGPMLAKDQSLANVPGPLNKISRSLYGALKQDIQEVIRRAEGPSAVSQYNVANARLRNGILELESDALKAILRKGNIKPEVVNNALFGASPSQARLLYANADRDGRAAIRGALLSRVATEALDKKNVISIPAFRAGLQKYRRQFGIAFNDPNDRATIDGLGRYLKITSRAEDYNADPLTGARMFMPAAIAGAFKALEAEIAALGTAGFVALAHAFESPTSRKLLAQLSRVKPNSDEEYTAVKRLTEAFNASVSNTAAETVRNKQLAFLQPNVKAEQMQFTGYQKPFGVLTDTTTGYRMISSDGKKFSLYGPDNKPIGIFSSQEEARKRADKEIRKRK